MINDRKIHLAIIIDLRADHVCAGVVQGKEIHTPPRGANNVRTWLYDSPSAFDNQQVRQFCDLTLLYRLGSTPLSLVFIVPGSCSAPRAATSIRMFSTARKACSRISASARAPCRLRSAWKILVTSAQVLDVEDLSHDGASQKNQEIAGLRPTAANAVQMPRFKTLPSPPTR
jgi:hypothetical protein